MKRDDDAESVHDGPDERHELTEEELRSQDGEPLPDREALSTLGPPPEIAPLDF